MNWSILPLSEFPRHAAQWDELQQQLQAPPFMSTRFLLPLIDVFAEGGEVLAIAAHPDKGVCAMGIFRRVGLGRWETFQPSQLPLGAWLAIREPAVKDLLASLMAALPGFNIGVALTQQDELIAARPAEAGALRTLDYIQTAWVDINGSFDDYWAARGKNLRSNMRKQKNKLDADKVSVVLETLREPADVAQAIAEYGRMESSGWKADGGTAIHPDNDQGRFYTRMMEAYCAAGQGCIYRYRFDDKPVAMDLCIESADTLVILKTTYDEAHKSLSPAFLMRHDAFPQLFAEKRIRRIEFYGKMMEWHTRWTDHFRTLYHVNFYRFPWMPALRGAAMRLLARRSSDPSAKAAS